MAQRDVMDEKVVRMSFDNSAFEKNVAQSMSTLDRLKAKFDFSWAKKSFDDLSDSANNVNMKGLGNAVEAVGTKFSVLETIATGALLRIGEKVADVAMNGFGVLTSKIREATTAQVDVGFGKYGEKTTAVQTIMSATGKSIEEVNEQLTKLNWFTDETSYTFTDMVSNIGKFTSAGVELNTAVTAMQGIATWAAISGQNAQAASRAMYNVSQAMGAGVMLKMDWNSLVNANMATKEFKQNLIRAATDMGKVVGQYTDKLGKTVYKIQTMEGGITETTVEGIAESLSDKWLTNDIFLKALDYYGGFTDKVYAAYEEFNENAEEFVLTSEIIEWVNSFKDGGLDIEEVSKRVGMSVEDVTAKLQLLSSAELDLGKRAFAAGQEAKTWEDAWGSVTEAVASGWMNTFEIIFGNYEEAKELWTGIANDLWDLFAGGAESRNELLEKWKDEGGRDEFVDSIFEFIAMLQDGVDLVKQSFENIFGIIESSQLVSATKKLKGFVSSLRFSQDEMIAADYSARDLRKSLKETGPIFEAMGNGYVYDMTRVLSVIRTFELYTDEALDSFEEYSTYFGDVDPKIIRAIIHEINDGTITINTFFETFTEYDNVQTLLDGLMGTWKNLADGLLTLGKTALQIARTVVPVTRKQIFLAAGAFGEWLGEINGVISSGKYLQKWCDKVVSVVSTVRESFLNGFLDIEGRGEILIPGAEELKNLLDKITGSVEKFVLTVRNKVDIAKFGRTARMALVDARDLLNGIFTVAKGIFDYFSPYIQRLSKTLGSDVKVVLTDIYNVVRKVVAYLYENETFTKIADGIVNFINNSKTLKTVMDTIVTVGVKLHDLFAGIYNGVKKFIEDNFPTLKENFPDTMEKISQKIGELDEKVGGVISNFRDWIDKSIDLSNVSEDVANALTTVKDLFTDFGAKAKAYYEEKWAPIFNSIGGFFVGLGKKYFPEGLLSLKSFFSDFRNNVAAMLHDIAVYATGELWQVIQDTNPALAKVLSVIGYAIGGVVMAVKKVWSVLSPVFRNVPDAASRMGDSISSAFDKVRTKLHEFFTELTGEESPMKQFLVILRNARTLAIIFGITSALKAFGEGFSDLGESFENAMKKFSFPLFAAGLLMVASALKTLAESLVMLSDINDERLAAITGVFTAIAGVVALLTFVIGHALKSITSWKQFLGTFAIMATITGSIRAFNGTITAFANGLKLLENVDTSKIVEGARALEVALAIVGSAVAAISAIIVFASGGRTKGEKNTLAKALLMLAAGIISLAAAIGVIIFVAKKLSQTLDWGEFVKGLGMIALATVVIGGLSLVISKIFGNSEGKFAIHMGSFILAILKLVAIAGVIAFVGGAIGDGLKSIRETIEKGVPELKEILLYLVEELCDVIVKASPTLCRTIVKVLVDILDALALAADPIINDLYNIIESALRLLFFRVRNFLEKTFPDTTGYFNNYVAMFSLALGEILAAGILAVVGIAAAKDTVKTAMGVLLEMAAFFAIFSAVIVGAGAVIAKTEGIEAALDKFRSVFLTLFGVVAGVAVGLGILVEVAYVLGHKRLTVLHQIVGELAKIFTAITVTFVVFGAAIVAAGYIISQVNGMQEALDTFAETFATIFGIFSLAIAVFSLVEKFGGSGVMTKAALDLAGVILVFAGVVMLIGVVVGMIAEVLGMFTRLYDEHGGDSNKILEDITKGFEFLTVIFTGLGNMIGGFTGGVVEAFAEKIGDTLVVISKKLEDFTTAIDPFLNWMKKRGGEVISGANVIATLQTVADIAGLAKDISKNTFETFVNSGMNLSSGLDSIRSALLKYREEDVGRAGAAADIITKIRDAAKDAPSKSDVTKLIGVTENMSTFAKNVRNYIEELMTLNKGNMITSEQTEMALKAAEVVNFFADSVKKMSEVSILSGYKDKFDYLITNLKAWAFQIKEFFALLQSGDFKESTVRIGLSAASILTSLADIAKKAPKMTDTDNLTALSIGLKTYGICLKSYAENITGIDEVEIKHITDTFSIIERLASVAKMIPNSGGSVANWLFGENDLGEFGSKLKVWGEGLGEYHDMIVRYGLDTEEGRAVITGSFDIIAELSDKAAAIDNEGGLYGLITGDKGLQGIAAGLGNYANSLKDYFTVIAEPYYQLVGGKAVQVVQMTGEQFKETIIATFDIIDSLGAVTVKYPDLGSALDSIGKGFGTLKNNLSTTSGYNYGMDLLKDIVDFMNNLADRDWDAVAVSFGNAIEYVAKDGVRRFTDTLSSKQSVENVKQSTYSLVKEVGNYRDAFGSEFYMFAKHGVSEFNSVMNDELTKSSIHIALDGIIFLLHEDMQSFLDEFKKNVSDTLKGAKSTFETYFEEFRKLGCELIEHAVSGMESMKQELYRCVTFLIDDAVETTVPYYGDFYDAGVNMAKGFEIGIQDGISGVEEAVKTMANASLDMLHETLDEHSPAEETENDGENYDFGFSGGIIRQIGSVQNAVKTMANSALDSLTGTLGTGSSDPNSPLSKLGTSFKDKFMDAFGLNGGENDKNSLANKLKSGLGDIFRNIGVDEETMSGFFSLDTDTLLSKLGFDPKNFGEDTLNKFFSEMDENAFDNFINEAAGSIDAFNAEQIAIYGSEEAYLEYQRQLDSTINSQNQQTYSLNQSTAAMNSYTEATNQAATASENLQAAADERAEQEMKTVETQQEALEAMLDEAHAQERITEEQKKQTAYQRKMALLAKQERFSAYMSKSGLTYAEQRKVLTYYNAARQFEEDVWEAEENHDAERAQKLREQYNAQTQEFNRYVTYLQAMRRTDITDKEKELIKLLYAKELGAVSESAQKSEKEIVEEFTKEEELSYFGRIKQEREANKFGYLGTRTALNTGRYSNVSSFIASRRREEDEAKRLSEMTEEQIAEEQAYLERMRTKMPLIVELAEKDAKEAEAMRKRLLGENAGDWSGVLTFLDSHITKNWASYETLAKDFKDWTASGHTVTEYYKIADTRRKIEKEFMEKYADRAEEARYFLNSDAEKDWTSLDALMKDFESYSQSGWTQTHYAIMEQKLEAEKYWQDRFSRMLREADKPNEDIVEEFLSTTMMKDWSSFETLQRDYEYWKANSVTYTQFLKIAAEQEEYKRRLIDARSEYGDKVYEFLDLEGVADWSSYEGLIRDFDEWVDTGKTYTQRMYEEQAVQEGLAEVTAQTTATTEKQTEATQKSTSAQKTANKTTADATVLTSEFAEILEALGNVAHNTAVDLSNLDSAIGGIASRIENGMSDLTIRPVIDFGEIQNGIEQVRTLLAEGEFRISLTPESLNVSLIASELVERGLTEITEIRMCLNAILAAVNGFEPVSPIEEVNVAINATDPDVEAIGQAVSSYLASETGRRALGWTT